MIEGYKQKNLELESTIESLRIKLTKMKMEINTMSAMRGNMSKTIDELRKQSVDAFEALKRMLELYDQHSEIKIKEKLQENVISKKVIF